MIGNPQLCSAKASFRTLTLYRPMAGINALAFGVLWVLCNVNAMKNVLLLIADDLRPQLNETYGHPWMVTPNLDALARESVVFDAAFTNFAICSPSRNSFMSGRMPDATRTWNFIDDFRTSGRSWMSAGEKWTTLPEFFKQQGYETLGHGKLYHPNKPQNNDEPYSWTGPYVAATVTQCPDGFQFCPGTNGKNDAAFSDYNTTLAAIETLAAVRAPWFVGLGLHFPHLSWATPQWCVDAYGDSLPSLAKHRSSPRDCPDISFTAEIDGQRTINLNASVYAAIDGKGPTHWPVPSPGNNTVPDQVEAVMRLGYYSAVTHTDWLFGQVLEAIEATKKDTLVVVTSDHGYSVGELAEWAKHTLFDNALRVPLMMRAPWLHAASTNRRTAAFFELIDLYRTIVALAGLDTNLIEPDVDGLDQSNLVLEPSTATPKRTATYAQYSRCPQQGRPAWYLNNCEQVAAPNISVMGFSVREPTTRFTEWYAFANCTVDFDTVVATEFYQQQDPALVTTGLANLDFDFGGTVNLASNLSDSSLARLRAMLRARFDRGLNFGCPEFIV